MKKILLAAIMIVFAAFAVNAQISGTGTQDPDGCRLYQNSPNVFEGTITVKFYLDVDCRVKLYAVKKSSGKVSELVEGDISAGKHGIIFKSPNSEPGEYICILQAYSHTNDSMIYSSEITIMQTNH